VRGVLSISQLDGAPGLIHGFSTLALGSMERSSDGEALTPARKRFAAGMGLNPEALTALKGVHGVEIARIERPMGEVIGVDGLMTSRPGLPLLATFADCRALILFDPGKPALGLFHAGWRGAAANLAAKAVSAMGKEFGSQSHDLLAGIGPGICGACYEVGPEVARLVPSACRRLVGDRLLVDLAALIQAQLLEVGVRFRNLHRHGSCTLETLELPSHRRCPDGSRFACLAAIT
jgi:polyphenol oxidase